MRHAKTLFPDDLTPSVHAALDGKQKTAPTSGQKSRRVSSTVSTLVDIHNREVFAQKARTHIFDGRPVIVLKTVEEFERLKAFETTPDMNAVSRDKGDRSVERTR